MDKYIKSLFLVFVLVISMSFTLAEEQSISTYSRQGAEYMDNGIIIDSFTQSITMINLNNTIYMTPYEGSGKPLDNSTTSCRFGITSPQGQYIYFLNQENFTIIGNNDIWVATIPGDFLNETGSYLYNWDCEKSINGGYFNGILKVTLSGKGSTLEELFSYIFLLFLLSALIFIISKKHDKTDFKAKRNNIVETHNNMKKTLVSGILLSLFKNSFIWIYFFGWFFIFILKDLIISFLSPEIYSYFEIFANIYSLGFLLVLVFMIGFTIDFMKGIIDDISDDNWGIE